MPGMAASLQVETSDERGGLCWQLVRLTQASSLAARAQCFWSRRPRICQACRASVNKPMKQVSLPLASEYAAMMMVMRLARCQESHLFRQQLADNPRQIAPDETL